MFGGDIIMIPIYEQGDGRGIGYNLDSFVARFESICQQHIDENRAKAFAFIFYDFTNRALRKILKDQGAFAKLDRLSGNNLSIFYLHTGTQHAVERFNNEFLSRLQLKDQATPPCVVFFKQNGQNFHDFSTAQLDNTNLLHGFQELYSIVEQYPTESSDKVGIGSKALTWCRSGIKFVSLETLRAALKAALGLIF
jgi:hypothetical protein